MDDRRLDPTELRQLIELFDVQRLSELEVEENGLRVALRRAPTLAAGQMAPAAVGAPGPSELVPPAAEPPEVEAPVVAPADDPRFAKVLSPMTGCFYRASSPDDPPFAEVGDLLEENQPIGLIEAMKVFSEIPTEVPGRLVDLCVKNGEMVTAGQVLAVVEPTTQVLGDGDAGLA